jgi:TolB-like protein
MLPHRVQHLLHELGRRRVFRVVGLYAVAAWAVLQVAATVFPILALPPWTIKLVLVLVVLGFPVALALAWAFDLEDATLGRAGDPAPDAPAVATGGQAPPPAGARIIRLPLARATLAALVTVLAAGGAWASLKRVTRAPAAAPGIVAVMPFEVRAGDGAAYLRDAMVSLLSARLDGAAGLRSTDPQTLLRTAAAGAVPDTDAARRAAARLGAGLYVLGSVVGAGGRIQVAASMYEAGARGVRVATATAEGRADSVFAIVDQLAIQLLSARAGPVDGTTRTAGRTTGSLAALRAYLDGERAYRETRIDVAIEAFGRAVSADSTFALAYSRLAYASSWHGDDSLAVWAAEAAERHSARLPPRYRELLSVDVALLRGDRLVETRLRQILARYPQDAEVWYRLGEVLTHRNPAPGRSSLEGREPFERALALDPGNELYLSHLREFACTEHRPEDLRALAPRAARPDSLNPLANGTMAGLAGRPAERDSVLDRLAAADDPAFYGVLSVALWCTPPDVLPMLFAAADRRKKGTAAWPERRAEFMLEMARGRWRAQKAILSPLRIHDPALEIFVRSYGLVAQPLLSPSLAELGQARADLLAMDGVSFATLQIRDTVYLPVHRLYHLGRLALRLHRGAEASEYAARLERLAASDSLLRSIAAFSAGSLRAHALAAAGRREEALRALDDLDALGLVSRAMSRRSGVDTDVRERWLRAELFRELGRDREALDWYVTVIDDTDPVFLAPSSLRAAQMRERLGQRREAADDYRMFIALWHDADPELQPFVLEARRRLTALER